MTVYEICYDLRQPGRNYASLILAIQGLGRAIRPLQSQWFVATAHSAAAIRDLLLPHIDAGDGLLVTRYGNQGAWHNVKESAALKQLLESAHTV